MDIKKININTPSTNSVVICGADAAEEFIPMLAEGRHTFLITDKNVYSLYRQKLHGWLGAKCPAYVLTAGEASKSYRFLLEILKAMLSTGLRRDCTVFAVGGGVVGDIAGLAASLYMRGVNLVQVPTTLLAQVDSSVGGKTAIDLCGVKNIVGAFYQPQNVVVDPVFLSTLPAREIRCGLGEIIKYGALDSVIYNKLINAADLYSSEFLKDITYDCIRHKADVVTADERETGGRRKTLNLGHTTAHAFELYYKRRSHGEFVLIGMYYELYIAVKKGICAPQYAQTLINLIQRVIKIPAWEDAEKAATLADYDKKNVSGGGISLIVPEREGVSTEIRLSEEEYGSLIAECARHIKEGA